MAVMILNSRPLPDWAETVATRKMEKKEATPMHIPKNRKATKILGDMAIPA
jgi:hypothetical protein